MQRDMDKYYRVLMGTVLYKWISNPIIQNNVFFQRVLSIIHLESTTGPVHDEILVRRNVESNDLSDIHRFNFDLPVHTLGTGNLEAGS